MVTNILELFTGFMGGSVGALALQAIGRIVISRAAKKWRSRRAEVSSLASISIPLRVEAVPVFPAIGSPPDYQRSVVPSAFSAVSNALDFPVADFLTCATCGLEAQSDLLTEHLEKSPSHRSKQIQVQPVVNAQRDASAHQVLEHFKAPPEPVDNLRKAVAEERAGEDDSQRAFRTLLQLLVPPRAFGLRTQNRTGNALANLLPRSSNKPE